MIECEWLPELISCYNWAKFSEYEEVLYSVFQDNFIRSKPQYDNLPVNIRKYPQVDNREQAFYHVTSRDYHNGQNREPDPERCKRIKWIRAFIEHYACDMSRCEACKGVKVWEEPYKNKQRIHIFLEEERYTVILERREAYILLITAFYLEHDRRLKKEINKYNIYK